MLVLEYCNTTSRFEWDYCEQLLKRSRSLRGFPVRSDSITSVSEELPHAISCVSLGSTNKGQQDPAASVKYILHEDSGYIILTAQLVSSEDLTGLPRV